MVRLRLQPGSVGLPNSSALEPTAIFRGVMILLGELAEMRLSLPSKNMK